MISSFVTGQCLPECIGFPNTMRWEMDGNGATALITADASTCREIGKLKNFKFKLKRFDGGMFFCLKADGLEQMNEGGWISAPYSPHVARAAFHEYPEGYGMMLTILLVRSTDGRIMQIDAIGLGNEFSNEIVETAKSIQSKPFDMLRYQLCVNGMYRLYPTDELLAEDAEAEYTIE